MNLLICLSTDWLINFLPQFDSNHFTMLPPGSQSQRHFENQITANVNSKYAVRLDQIGCWTRVQGDRFDGGNDFGDCQRSPTMFIG